MSGGVRRGGRRVGVRPPGGPLGRRLSTANVPGDRTRVLGPGPALTHDTPASIGTQVMGPRTAGGIPMVTYVEQWNAHQGSH